MSWVLGKWMLRLKCAKIEQSRAVPSTLIENSELKWVGSSVNLHGHDQRLQGCGGNWPRRAIWDCKLKSNIVVTGSKVNGVDLYPLLYLFNFEDLHVTFMSHLYLPLKGCWVASLHRCSRSGEGNRTMSGFARYVRFNHIEWVWRLDQVMMDSVEPAGVL